MRETPYPVVTRRAFLAGISGTAALLLARGASAAGESGPLPRDAFRFLVLNDLHHAEPACDLFLESLVSQLRTHGPVAFCLLVGDLADRGARSSLEAVRRIIGTLGCPVHAVPGNHDCDVALDTSLYAEIFPNQLNHHFAHAGWQFIGLDSTEGVSWHETTISAPTLDFLDRIVPELDVHAPTVVFTHFPLAEGIRMRPLNADAVLARLEGLNLRAVLGGHFHSRTEQPWRESVLTTNACCSRVRANHDETRPEGYQLCTAHRDGRLDREFIEFKPASDSPPPESSPPY
jgi:calcineurin-like phosphoesterase family protein